MAGDKTNVTLPNENLNKDFRIISLEINAIPEQILNMRFELGFVPPLWIDYVYESREKLDRHLPITEEL